MFNIPHVPRKAFKRQFIARAFCEIRFPVQLDTDWNTKKNQLPAFLKETEFVKINDATETSLEIPNQIDNSTLSAVKFSSTRVGIAFTNIDGSKSVQIAKDRVIISLQNYKGFDAFWNDVAFAIKAVGDLFSISSFSWIGIRKQNTVGVQVSNGMYLGEGVNSMLFTPLRQQIFDPKSLQVGESTYVISKDKTTAIIRTNATRQADQNMSVNIDLDVNREIEGVNSDALIQIAKQLNELSFDIFCWATDPSLLKALDE